MESMYIIANLLIFSVLSNRLKIKVLAHAKQPFGSINISLTTKVKQINS